MIKNKLQIGKLLIVSVVSSVGSFKNPVPPVFLFWKGLEAVYVVLSPEGICVAYPVGVQWFFLMFYFGLGRVYCTFKNPLGFLRFLNLENVLSPEGRYVVYPVGSN